MLLIPLKSFIMVTALASFVDISDAVYLVFFISNRSSVRGASNALLIGAKSISERSRLMRHMTCDIEASGFLIFYPIFAPVRV